MPVRLYGSETIIWREKETSRIRVVRMENLRNLLIIRKMDRIPNARIIELCGVAKVEDCLISVMKCLGIEWKL